MSGIEIASVVVLIIGTLVLLGVVIRILLGRKKTPTKKELDTKPEVPEEKKAKPDEAKSKPPSATRKFLSGYVMVMILISLVGATWHVTKTHERQSLQQEFNMILDAKSFKYDWYWVLQDGQVVNGRSEIAPDERVVEFIPQSDGSLRFTQHYVEYGKPEDCRIHLPKTGANTWSGTWEQDRPKQHGTITIDQMSPGVYAGERTWSTGESGRCWFRKR